MPSDKLVSVEEIKKHATPEDCWLVIDNVVWDLSEYAPSHPGGAAIIQKHAGRDATESYSSIHAPSIISNQLPPSKRKGQLDTSTITEEWLKPPPGKTPEAQVNERPDISTIINSHDFETVAQKTLSEKTWAFYSSAATDCITREENNRMLGQIFFRPRLLRDVKNINMQTRMLGCNLKVPLFISPAAMAKLVDKEGERALARGAQAAGIVQMVSNNASYPIEDILEAVPDTQPTFFQLYVNQDRTKTKALLEKLLSYRPKIKGIFITIDAPIPGKREADERLKADESIQAPNSGARATNDAKGGGLGRIMGSYIDKALTWQDLRWIRSIVGPDMPLGLKGVQHSADAILADEAGMQAIIVSNHGGRSLDTSPPAILALLDMHRNCPAVFEKLEVYIDSGIRRGSDILKCLCLGATAVGMGRSFLYSLTYGQQGVEHLVEIMRDELETSMRLVGITDLDDCTPDYVNTGALDHLVPSARYHPYAHKLRRSRL